MVCVAYLGWSCAIFVVLVIDGCLAPPAATPLHTAPAISRPPAEGLAADELCKQTFGGHYAFVARHDSIGSDLANKK